MFILIQSPESSRECFYKISERRAMDNRPSYCYFVGEFMDAEPLNNKRFSPYNAVARYEDEKWILYWSLGHLVGRERSGTSFAIPEGLISLRRITEKVHLLMKGEISL